MKNTLKNIALGATLATVLFSSGCDKEQNKKDSRLPEVSNNQTLILHPDYLRGTVSLGYTLLTDMDYDGSWDVAEGVHAGYTTGDGSHKLIYKKGYGPAQSVDIPIEFADPSYFKAFE